MDPVDTSQDEDLPTSTQDTSSSSLADPATSDQTSLLDQTLTSSSCPKKSEALPTTSNTTPESLSTPSAALLIFAECVGTGILALPYFCFVLPRGFGIFYLLLNYLVNVYCASLLCTAASLTEARLNLPHPVRDLVALADKVHSGNMPLPLSPLPSSSASPPPPSSLLPRLCRFFFCTNLFLLLGTYLLTMAKGLATSFSSPPSIVFNVICIFSLMALTASLSKMSQLGRSPTYISIATVFVVLVVCLLAPHEKTSDAPDIPQLVLIPSSFSGITFAMGSQKLLLNVRSEMADTSTSFKSVVWALSAYSSLYVLVVLLAPPTPPPLLMDAVTSPAGKVVAGIALVVHIAVSFTINSQALTSLVRDISGYAGRWGYLSLCMCAVVFCVTLAIPFFADLTSLIGSLTMVPLTILLPMALHRNVTGWLEWSAKEKNFGYCVFSLSVVAMVAGVATTVAKIGLDWQAKVA
ncbi:hypothetical protein TeGR_g3143 [Tetraparma gracilis]|uniref:Amino acid transporter transmembrane domain-containing protein n=1 Tax=Tetraparma gracilis TaxID=2962635 RepID=A0ABQ6MSV2_9STRA|nr:hypothetical protein TeGR_g3143 [Tetraparma gracilis]